MKNYSYYNIIFHYLKCHETQKIFHYFIAKVVEKMYFREFIYRNYVSTQQASEPKMEPRTPV
jgi:hypothetical protein